MNEADMEALSSGIGIALMIVGIVAMVYAVFVSRDWMLLSFGAVCCYVGVNLE